MARRISVEIVGDASQLERTFGKASASASVFQRDISRASRGALAGSGVFQGLGRSIAFASGGFLAFASAGEFLRKSLDAAREAVVTQKQMSAQFRASGLTLSTYQGQIEKTTNRLSALAGIPRDQLASAFTTIFRGSGNVSKALQDTALAADIAAGRHIGLAQASIAVGKAAAGSTTALRRLGIELPKGATGAQAIALAMQRFRGQAVAAATEQSKFAAILHNSQVIIGGALLPTLNRYLTQASAWLEKMNESGRLQKDVNNILKDAGRVMRDLAEAAHVVASAFRGLDHITGSFENTLKNFAEIWLVLKARTALIRWGVIESGITGIGSRAAIASGEVGGLAAGLARLASLGPIAVAIALQFVPQAKRPKSLPQSSPGAENFLAGLPIVGGTFSWANKISDEINAKLGITSGGAKTGAKMTTPSQVALGLTFAQAKMLNPSLTRYEFDLGRSIASGGKIAAPPPPKGPQATAKKGSAGLSLQGQFNVDELRLADAGIAGNKKLQASILHNELTITLKLRDQANTLKDRTKYAQQAASIQDQIRSLDQQGVTAANKAAEAARKKAAAAAKAALGGVPLSLQLAQAKADAIAAGIDAQNLTKGQIAAAKAIRAHEYKAIKSHMLSMQGLIDAWNEIAQINQQLQGQGKGLTGTYKTMSAAAFTSGLGLTGDSRRLAEERYAQAVSHRGHRPATSAALGQPVGGMTINTVNVYGVRNIDQLYSELEKAGKRRHQRRGGR